jgi:hypothetical protein
MVAIQHRAVCGRHTCHPYRIDRTPNPVKHRRRLWVQIWGERWESDRSRPDEPRLVRGSTRISQPCRSSGIRDENLANEHRNDLPLKRMFNLVVTPNAGHVSIFETVPIFHHPEKASMRHDITRTLITLLVAASTLLGMDQVATAKTISLRKQLRLAPRAELRPWILAEWIRVWCTGIKEQYSGHGPTCAKVRTCCFSERGRIQRSGLQEARNFSRSGVPGTGKIRLAIPEGCGIFSCTLSGQGRL